MSLFAPEVKTKIEKELTRYETKRSAILPILHLIQDHYRFVSDEQVQALETDYGLSKIQVREVLTFYSLYHTSKPADFEILFCDNIVCAMMGAKKVMGKIQERIDNYEAKGKSCPFSLEGVPCLGVCDGAPAMLVNKDRYLKVNEANVEEVLNKYAPR